MSRVFANIAQLVEQRIRNAPVGGSNPLVGSIFQAARDAPRGFLFPRRPAISKSAESLGSTTTIKSSPGAASCGSK